MPAQPASASFFSHARENTSRSSNVFGSLKPGSPHPSGRLPRIHALISWRNAVSSGLNVRSIVVTDSMRHGVASAHQVAFAGCDSGTGADMDRAERIQLARDISDAFIERHGEAILATGIRGS